MPTFAERHALLPLDDLVASDKFDLSVYFKTMVDAMSSNGKLYGLPWDFGPLMLFYNKTLFDKYNVPYPSSDPSKWTWDAFLDAAKKLTHQSAGAGDTDTWGFFAPPELDRGMYGFILEGGGDLQDPSMRKATLNTPQVVKAMQFYDDLINKYHVAPPLTDTRNANATGEQWPTGNYAMMQEGTWMIQEFARTAKSFNWDIALLPAGPDGSQSFVAGSGYSITAKTKHKKEAWEALKAMAGTDAEIYIAQNRSYPALKLAVPTFEKRYAGLSLPLIPKQQESARAFKTRSTFQEAWTTMAPIWDKMFLHQTSVEDGLNQINQIYQKTLDESWK
jgi:ABC-type glycerol-3-phosphate transport system substrate-binding protein